MRVPRAVCLIPDKADYRHDAFQAGLQAAGFRVDNSVAPITRPTADDLLVVWNRYGSRHDTATRFEAVGAPVIVAENGYVGATETSYAKPLSADGAQLYALALNRHNGCGGWPVGAAGRWREQGIQVAPWRKNGHHVLLLPQRGIGVPPAAMPRDWEELTLRRLKSLTNRPIRVRRHPGNMPATRPLASDLRDCWAAVTWGSGAAVKTICMGVPVFHDLERWIGARAALPLAANVEQPLCDDAAREAMLDDLAWAQATTTEIATGEPFLRLLDLHESRKAAA